MVLLARAFRECRYISGEKKSGLAELLGQLRKETGLGLSKCRDALAASNNDLKGAIAWLEKNEAEFGTMKAEKLKSRLVSQGLIGICRRDISAGTMIELNCETDFVARNEIFQDLFRSILHTISLYYAEPSQLGKSSNIKIETVNQDLNNIPIYSSEKEGISQTIGQAIVDAIGKLGENIQLRRVAHMKTTQGIIGDFVHGTFPKISINGSTISIGKIGALLNLNGDTSKDNISTSTVFANQLAQHIVGCGPLGIHEQDVVLPDDLKKDSSPSKIKEFYDQVLFPRQKFLFDEHKTVDEIIRQATVDMNCTKPFQTNTFSRYMVGEASPTS